MAFALDEYTASPSQTDFTITFSYRDEADVLVYEDGVLKTQGASNDYTFFNSTTIRFNSGLTGGELILIQRSTSQSTRLTDYTAGALTEADLDNDSLQGFRMAQESIDIANRALGRTSDGANFDAETKQVKNVVDPTVDQDAATKAYVDAAAAGTLGTPLSVANGGTGQSTTAGIRTALGIREKLTANRTYYVRTDGSDSNTGLVDSAAGGFLTVQKAIDVAFLELDLAGYDVTIDVGNGTYTDPVSMDRPQVGQGYISITGDTTTPSNVVFSTTSRDCVYAGGGANIRISGVKLTAATAGFGLHAGAIGGDGSSTTTAGTPGGIQVTGKMEYGAVANGYAHAYADFGGVIQMGNTDYTISGGGGAHMWTEDGGRILNDQGGTPTVTVSGTPAFAVGFAVADKNASIRHGGATTYSGSATGKRFRITNNGTIITADSGLTYFPGDTAGTTDTGGKYDGNTNQTGTWTPTLTFTTAGDQNIVQASTDGSYTVHDDDTVTVTWLITTSTFTHSTASGELVITGLPFTSQNETLQICYGTGIWQGITKTNYTHVVPQVQPNTSQIVFGICGSGQNADTVDAADAPSGGTVTLAGTLTYKK